MSTQMTHLLLRVYVYFLTEVFRFQGGWVGHKKSEHCSDFKNTHIFLDAPLQTFKNPCNGVSVLNEFLCIAQNNYFMVYFSRKWPKICTKKKKSYPKYYDLKWNFEMGSLLRAFATNRKNVKCSPLPEFNITVQGDWAWWTVLKFYVNPKSTD